MKILVVAGHPADMFDHCGGTLLKHIQRGDEVSCVALTQGLRSHDEVITGILRYKANEYTKEEIDNMVEERAKVKYAEVLKACKMFGLEDIRFLDYDDEFLTLNAGIISKLATVIRQVQPDMVITHWPYQGGGISNHHAVTGQIAINAVGASSAFGSEDNLPGAHVAQTVFMLCPWDTHLHSLEGMFKPAYVSYYVDVTDVIDLKVKAVAAMQSQKYDVQGYAKKVAERWNGAYGLPVRLAYAEGFAFENPEVGDYLPLSKHRLWLANADEKEILAKSCTFQAMDVEIDERI